MFTDVTEELGIDPPDELWPDGTYELPEAMGGGVALFDYDNDGDLDLLQVRNPPPGQAASPAQNRLFQQQPDRTFTDVTLNSGLGDPGYGQGVAVGDVDGDGDLDVFLTNFGADAFYRNEGDGTFSNQTDQAGFTNSPSAEWSTSAAFFDYDRDNDLDLYVVNYVDFDPGIECSGSNSVPDYCGPRKFDATLDSLFRNNGDGTFEDVTAEAGITRPGRGLGVVTTDLTGDGQVDIYVANDGEVNHLWVNRGDGTFAEEAIIRGVGFNLHGQPEASMGIAAGDVDGDANIDLFMTHLAGETNTLYMAGDPGIYTDSSARWGLSVTDRPFTGFGCGFFDYDNDRDLDLVLVNGAVKRVPLSGTASPGGFWSGYMQSNLLFENTGSRFVDRREIGGALTANREVSRGLAFGDVDNDGDVDLAEGTIAGVRLYRNSTPDSTAHWLVVRALTGNRDAIGARVTLVAGDVRMLREVLPAYSYLSSSDPRVHFGLGDFSGAAAIELTWPDGRSEVFQVPGVDRILTVRQGQGAPL